MNRFQHVYCFHPIQRIPIRRAFPMLLSLYPLVTTIRTFRNVHSCPCTIPLVDVFSLTFENPLLGVALVLPYPRGFETGDSYQLSSETAVFQGATYGSGTISMAQRSGKVLTVLLKVVGYLSRLARARRSLTEVLIFERARLVKILSYLPSRRGDPACARDLPGSDSWPVKWLRDYPYGCSLQCEESSWTLPEHSPMIDARQVWVYRSPSPPNPHLLFMHRFWQIDELVRLVASELEKGCGASASAVALACCSKRLSDSVLDPLWEELIGLSRLVKCLPPDTWETRDGKLVRMD